MVSSTADVVVIGGGVNGTSIAMHLARMGAGRVVLVEKGHLAGGASGRSGAMVREHYLHPTLVRMATESREIFQNFGDAVGGDPRFVQGGRILMFPERDEPAVRANVEMNRDLGVNIETLTPVEVSEMVPQASMEEITIGTYEPDAGHADPVSTTYAYAERARDFGAEIHTQTPVSGLVVSGGRIAGVETTAGTIATSTVVAAVGPWCHQLGATVGESLPVTPIRVQMVHLRRPPTMESVNTNIIDYSTGAYFRVYGDYDTVIGGEALEDLMEVANPDAFGLNADHDVIMRFWERAKYRFPEFESAICRGGYGSLYDMTPDGNPILDRSQSVEGLYWAVGFSGHGFKLSPVVGRMVAELVLGESGDHPVGQFRATRFAEGDLLGAEHPYEGRRHQ